MEVAALWVIGENKIIASKYASNSALVFDHRYEINEDNVNFSFPTAPEFKLISSPFPIWMKRAITRPDVQPSQVGDEVDGPSDYLFGISIIDSCKVNLGKSSYRCRFALVLMVTQLHIGAMQELARMSLKRLREGWDESDQLSGLRSYF